MCIILSFNLQETSRFNFLATYRKGQQKYASLSNLRHICFLGFLRRLSIMQNHFIKHFLCIIHFQNFRIYKFNSFCFFRSLSLRNNKVDRVLPGTFKDCRDKQKHIYTVQCPEQSRKFKRFWGLSICVVYGLRLLKWSDFFLNTHIALLFLKPGFYTNCLRPQNTA